MSSNDGKASSIASKISAPVKNCVDGKSGCSKWIQRHPFIFIAILVAVLTATAWVGLKVGSKIIIKRANRTRGLDAIVSATDAEEEKYTEDNAARPMGDAIRANQATGGDASVAGIDVAGADDSEVDMNPPSMFADSSSSE